MDYKKIVSNKELRFKIMRIFSWVPDIPWLKLLFRIKNGYWMDFKHPKTFNEKLQWLKVYDNRPEYTQMVDKYGVKDYVTNKIGAEYVIPTLGVWNKPEDIDWDTLPKEFVLKTTTGGGGFGVWIVKDKDTFDKESFTREVYARYPNIGQAHKPHPSVFREHPYEGVKELLIAEEMLKVSDKDSDLKDYKFFCFNGKVKFFKVDFGRFIEHRANYYTPDCQLLPYGEVVCPPDPEAIVEIPANISKMVELAEKLSAGIPFLRVDLYNLNDQIYFGELTFFPASGLSKWTDDKWDQEIGEMIDINV